MQVTITLINHNCPYNCNICSYGKSATVPYEQIKTVAKTLMDKGFAVHLYDMHVNSSSLEVYKLTGQYEKSNPGWLNVTADFSPDKTELSYINSLKTVIAISLHGSTSDVHMLSSGNKDYDKVVSFIKNKRSMFKLPLGVNYVINKKNMHDLDKMLDLCEREFELDFLEVIPLGYSGNASECLSQDYALSTEDKQNIVEKLLKKQHEYSFDIEFDPIWGPDFIVRKNFKCSMFAKPLLNHYCNAGINHFGLRLSDNLMFPCPCMAGIDEFSCGYFDGTKIIINNNWILQKEKIKQPCNICEKFDVCHGGCRLTAVSDASFKAPFDKYSGLEQCLFFNSRDRIL